MPLGCQWPLGARSVLCLCPGLRFRVRGKSDLADPHALGRACGASKDVGLAAGLLAVQIAAVGRALRAWHRSWPFVPRWWEIRFGRPSIVARCMLAG
jgi:hypothetical protein